MRLLTLHPDPARGPAPCTTEVDVDPGTTVGALRPHLARLTGWSGWASTAVRLAVDDALLDETHPVGHHPLLPGAVLRAGAGQPPPERLAVQARRHVAVVAGPAGGALVAVPDDGVATLDADGERADVRGSGAAAVEVRGRRRRVHVRVAPSSACGPVRLVGSRRVADDRTGSGRTPSARPGRWRAQSAGRRPGRWRAEADVWRPGLSRTGAEGLRSARLASCGETRATGTGRVASRVPALPVRRRGGARELPPGRWVRWREHHGLVVGRAVLALRPGPASLVDGAVPGPGDEPGRAHGRGDAEQVVAWLAPLAGSVALALVLRQPALLLVGLVVPLVGLGVHVARRRRRRGGPNRRATVQGRGPGGARRPGTAQEHGFGGPDGRERTQERAPVDPADLVAATTAATLGGEHRLRGGVPWSADGCLAVVGETEDAAATARAVVLAELGSHAAADLVVVSRRPDGWAWTAPVEPRPSLPAPHDPDAVVVCDDPDAIGRLATWRAGTPRHHRLLLVLDRRTDVPAWCRHVLEVTPAGARLHAAGAAPAVLPWHAVTAGRARTQLLRARTLRGLCGERPPAAAPPDHVALGDLRGIPAPRPDAVVAAWSGAGTGLVARIGRSAGSEDVVVDLVADGPHALVAGTTGAGKSELLTTLVLALALTHAPDRLALLLVDFKGGTGLGAVAGLPHVLDHVTDLDPARTQRVLAGLRAETRRRERLLAAHGAHDLTGLDPDDHATPPRLLVVVDELRALADDVPDAVATLARLAAQGRALGIHLVLATQRPAGVVTADLRANVDLRIALRVTDDADSRDVVDDPQAARLDPRTPGRAVLRRGSLPTEIVQAARPRAGTGAPPARLATPHLDGAPAGWVPRPAPVPRSWTGDDGRDDGVRAWVEAAAVAADGRRGGHVPWVPALPARVTVRDVPGGPGLAVALGDLPHEQRRCPVRWVPCDGHLLVLGGPGSGRTTTLTALGTQALAVGMAVHTVGLPAAAVARLRRSDVHGRLGTVVGVDEVRRLARLLELLTSSESPALLLVDGLTDALDRLATLARGAGADRLVACWRGDGRVAVAAGTDVTTAALHHAASFRDRLVLPVADASLDALAGVPSTVGGPRGPAGRAVHLRDGDAVVCQVVEPPEPATAGSAPRTRAPDPVARDAVALAPVALHAVAAAPAAPDAVVLDAVPADRVAPDPVVLDAVPTDRIAPDAVVPDPSVVRVLPLPRTARLPVTVTATGPTPTAPTAGTGREAAVAHPPVAQTDGLRGRAGGDPTTPGHAVRGLVPIGVGGDDASEVVVDTSRPLLVAGPPGSGRTTALAVMAAGLRAAGARVVRLVDGHDRPPALLIDIPVVAPDGVPDDAVVLVDDLDELERASPSGADVVERLARDRRGARVVAATTAQAAGAFRGPHAAMVRACQVLVLDAHDPACADLVGHAAPWLVDPRERPPGRGVLVVDRRAVPVQVYAPVRVGAAGAYGVGADPSAVR